MPRVVRFTAINNLVIERNKINIIENNTIICIRAILVDMLKCQVHKETFVHQAFCAILKTKEKNDNIVTKKDFEHIPSGTFVDC